MTLVSLAYSYRPQLTAAALATDADDGVITRYDHRRGQVVSKTRVDEQPAVALSADGKRSPPLTGSEAVSISGMSRVTEIIASHGKPRKRTSEPAFDSTGRFVAWWSEVGSYVAEIENGAIERIAQCESVKRGSLNEDTNEFLVPTTRKGSIARISFGPLAVEELKVPLSGRIGWLRHSPKEPRCLLLTTQGMYSYSMDLETPLWSLDLRQSLLRHELSRRALRNIDSKRVSTSGAIPAMAGSSD